MPACFGCVRIGAGEQEAVVGVMALRGPHLLAVDDPLVAVEHRGGLQAGEVGTRVRLGEPLAPARRAAEDARQELLLLLLAAPLQQRRTDERVAEEVAAHRRLGVGELLGEHDALHRGEALAAVLGRPGGADPAALEQLLRPLVVELLALGVGHLEALVEPPVRQVLHQPGLDLGAEFLGFGRVAQIHAPIVRRNLTRGSSLEPRQPLCRASQIAEPRFTLRSRHAQLAATRPIYRMCPAVAPPRSPGAIPLEYPAKPDGRATAQVAGPLHRASSCPIAYSPGMTTVEADAPLVPPAQAGRWTAQWKELYAEVITTGLCTGCAGVRRHLPPRRDRLRARGGQVHPVPSRRGARPRQLHPRREGLHHLHPGVPALPGVGAGGRHAPVRPGPRARRDGRHLAPAATSPGPATTWCTRWARTAGSCRRC